ncbi:phosphoethanolamine--lipid A transferase [Defluviimonas sp. WL0002]|uniref:Phosphoethanolamine--lipid A transferase n=1 Tax=Albidovulum marisflavi TaxID=2984159 RepID=A0ABT2Z978_9RHOB|nr:phosphoethanolamine--lipid A transferase [Defluviimonas sp. WL0002]MCV2867688.1 phosphoethanolamine--lipid A transferase [Defluviimonas sp. WL0002]
MTEQNACFANRLKLPRPVIGQTALNLIVAVYILAILNTGFWNRLIDIFGDSPFQAALFATSIFALTVLTLEFLAPGRLQRPVATVLILVSASAHYYERAFGVLIDREMVRNVLETTVTESRHLMTMGAVSSIILTGVLPAALLFWPRVARVKRWHHLWRWPLGVTLSLAVLVGGLFADFKTFSAVLRERKDLMASYQPGATIAAVTRYAKQQFKAEAGALRAIATDAAPGPFLAAADKPVLLVLFVGETARAQNFGLNGYARQTTPGLAERDVINLPDVSSCGTSTAVSLPCMFSNLSQVDYTRDKFLAQENLLDVLARAGFAVRWVDNNTGDQHIAARTGWDRVDAALDAAACAVECTDEAFLPLIRQTLDTITQNTVLVLHMIGNHGPAYHLRYPRDRAVFAPDCQTAEFADCTVDEIVNAYDNAILETDYVLSQTIDMLSGSDRALTAMLYLSDHGESLGEGGLYLHAAPMFMAPETQTKVPMVLWLDDGYKQAMGLDAGCLAKAAARPASQDNLFHSVLGLLDVATTARDPGFDLTQGCQEQRAS